MSGSAWIACKGESSKMVDEDRALPAAGTLPPVKYPESGHMPLAKSFEERDITDEPMVGPLVEGTVVKRVVGGRERSILIIEHEAIRLVQLQGGRYCVPVLNFTCPLCSHGWGAMHGNYCVYQQTEFHVVCLRVQLGHGKYAELVTSGKIAEG